MSDGTVLYPLSFFLPPPVGQPTVLLMNYTFLHQGHKTFGRCLVLASSAFFGLTVVALCFTCSRFVGADCELAARNDPAVGQTTRILCAMGGSTMFAL